MKQQKDESKDDIHRNQITICIFHATYFELYERLLRQTKSSLRSEFCLTP